MSQEKQVFSIDLAGRQLTVETGQLAKQANGAVLVRYGDTAVLSTATASKEAKNVDLSRIIALDDKVNSELTIDLEEKSHKKYKFNTILKII